jgi:hypothetical protein
MFYPLVRSACGQPVRAALLLAAPAYFASLAGAQSWQPSLHAAYPAPLHPAPLHPAPVHLATMPAVSLQPALRFDHGATQERPTVADVRILLEDEKPSAAFDAAKIALEDSPTDPLLFDLAAQSALALGKEDEALWYTRLGVRELERLEEVPKEQEPLLQGLRARQLELDPKTEDLQELLDDYARDAYDLARSAASGKLHVNAADMFLRLRGTASEGRALKELEKVYGDDDASETLFRYGFELPEGQLRGALKNKSPRQIAKEDEEHANWENRYEFANKRPAYRVFTNMGQVTGRQILDAMVQINEFICDAFGMRTTKQECKINVFKDFDSFSETEGIGSPNIGGFFSPSETRISTYDQSTVGRAYDQLWKTLFHEATHQVAQELSNTLLPAWIEEGNACYFEGVELLPTGRLVANLVPESRLRGLLSMLGPRPESYREPWKGVPKVGGGAVKATEASTKTSADRAWLGNPASRPDLVSFPPPADARVRIKEVITYFQPGSYSGAFYPWGWGLIYFLRNYEDANGELVYSAILDDYIKAYHKREDHNVWDRFQEYFIEGAEREGIEDFDDFYGMWAQWIWDLGDLYYGGAEAADPLYHRAMVQIEQGNPERAAHTLRWALEKRPSDPLILMQFAEVQSELKNKDEAVYALRRALSWARSQSKRDAEVNGLDMTVEELEDECFERIGKVNRKLTSGAQETDEEFIDKAVALAATYAEEGYPLRGLLLLDEATEMIGSVHSLTDRREALAEEHGVDPRLRRRMAADLHADKWGGSSTFLGDGADLEFVPTPGLRRATWLEDLPRRYRLEGTLEVVGGMIITFGDDSESGIGGGFRVGNLLYGWQQDEGFGRIEERSGEEGGLRMVEKFADESPLDEYAVALEVREGLVRVYIDGELVAEDEVSESDTRGRVGVWGSGTPLTYKSMYLTY